MYFDWQTQRIIHKQRVEEAHKEARKDRNRRIAIFNLNLPFLGGKKKRKF